METINASVGLHSYRHTFNEKALLFLYFLGTKFYYWSRIEVFHPIKVKGTISAAKPHYLFKQCQKECI